MEGCDLTTEGPSQSDCAQPVFGVWRAPVLPTAASEDHGTGLQGHDRQQLTKSPQSLVHPLRQSLLMAEDTIEKLTQENIHLRQLGARLSMKHDSVSTDLEELQIRHSETQMENEELRNRIDKLEKHFENVWQLSKKKQLEETKSLRAELLVAQTLRDNMAEEVKEHKRQLQEGRERFEREIASLEESLRIQKEEKTTRLFAVEDHCRQVIRVARENATTKMMDSEEKWQRSVSQLEDDMKETRRVVQSELRQSEKKCGSRCNALEESYRKALDEREETWQRRVQETERKYEHEIWVQKEEEWRAKVSALGEEINRLIEEVQGKKKKQPLPKS